jgi:hypothetical protein
MRAVAKWLVARPLNGVLVLAATSSPYLGFLSAALVVLLALHGGTRLAVLKAAGAGLLLGVIGVIVGTPPSVILAVAAVYWLPALLLATLLTVTRSLTLTLQVSVLVAVLGMLVFFGVVGDPVAFWEAELGAAAEIWRSMGAVELADSLTQGQAMLAAQMTMFIVTLLWTIYAATLVLGYTLFQQLPGETDRFGRFRDLSFGRVLALIMALCSLVALVTGAAWLQNIAFVMFAVFWLQGLAIMHWLHGVEALPGFAVAMVYVLMLPLSAVVVIGLAVLGYIDAWFDLRRRAPVGRGKE